MDDVTQRAVATAGVALGRLKAAALLFHSGATAKGVAFAPKSRCVGTDPQAARDLAAVLQQAGLPIKAAEAAPDLRIDRGRIRGVRARTRARTRWNTV